MNRQTDTSPPANARLLARLFDRIDPLAWSAADKCLFAASVFLTFSVWYLVSLYYARVHPEVTPYIDHAFLPFALRMQSIIILAWTTAVVVSLAVRHRPGSRILVVVTLVLCSCEILYGSYISGLYTSLFSFTFIPFWAVGLILFNKRAITWTFMFISLGLLGITACEQAGLIRYAPLFRGTPVEGGRLHVSFIIGLGGVTLLMMIGIGLILYFVIERWKDREAKLAVASEQIARANDLISRYVATQVSQQIFAGNYGAVDRHDRRKLTLFFSDIKGFSEVADTIEPEDLSRILNEYLSEMTGIAERYGATVDKFVGDAIMVFFGAPMATDDRDHALRAVRMAIEMQRRLAELRTKWLREGIEEPFEIRIGINTGVASVGNFGSKGRVDYTAIGRQVNLAARLEVNCDPGKILLSHSTWSLVQDDIACIAKGEIQVKGFHQAVKVYEVAA